MFPEVMVLARQAYIELAEIHTHLPFGPVSEKIGPILDKLNRIHDIAYEQAVIKYKS